MQKAQKRSSLRVEAAGLSYLKLRLLQADYEVAVPDFDNGIDLIAFRDLRGSEHGFIAWPIQLKASSEASFSVDSKYDGRGIFYAYVWNVFDNPSLFIVSYENALEILGERKRATASFKSGSYGTTKPSQQIRRDLAPFSAAERWFKPG